MEKKNIFIIIAIILVVAVIVFYIIFSKNMNSTSNNIPLNQSQNSSSTIPRLSGGELNDISQEVIAPQYITDQIKSNIESAKNMESKISEFTVKNSSGENLSFRSFLQSSGLKMDESVLRLSDQTEYSVSNCSTDSFAPATGLIFEVNKDQDLKNYVDSVDRLTEAVKKWENKMFQDLSILFFPGESFSQIPSFNEIRFDTSNNINSVIVRFANLKSESGKTFSVDWSMFNNQIFISNDKECLRNMLNERQDQLEP